MLTEELLNSLVAEVSRSDDHCGHIDEHEFARAIESAVAAPLLAQIEEQLRAIQALNSVVNGHGSTTTENLTIVGRLEDRLAELESQLAAAAKDAESYKQVRRGQHWSVIDGIGNALRGDDLDAAIARTKAQP